MLIIFQLFRHLFLELFCAEPASKLRYSTIVHSNLATNTYNLNSKPQTHGNIAKEVAIPQHQYMQETNPRKC